MVERPAVKTPTTRSQRGCGPYGLPTNVFQGARLDSQPVRGHIRMPTGRSTFRPPARPPPRSPTGCAPEITVICRDRTGVYVTGATAGAHSPSRSLAGGTGG